MSAALWREFRNSSVWYELKKELNVWLENVRDHLESSATDENELYRNQGRADAVRYLLGLPRVMQEVFEEAIEEATEKEE